jgi:hypothetical protein
MKEVNLSSNITAPKEFNRTPRILPAPTKFENPFTTPVKGSVIPAGTGSSEASLFKSVSIVQQGSAYVLACGTIRGIGTASNQ